jgi:predicted DNA-binding transcriptional regulator AlpA
MKEVSEGFQLAVDERQAARLLGVTTAGLRKWRREGRPPRFVRIGKCVRYPLSEIRALVSLDPPSIAS